MKRAGDYFLIVMSIFLSVFMYVVPVNAMTDEEGRYFQSHIKLSSAPVYEEVMENAWDSFAYDEDSFYGKRYTVTVPYYCEECVQAEGSHILDYSAQAYDTHHFSGDKEYLYTLRYNNFSCGHNPPKGSTPEETGYWKLIETKVLESNLLTEALSEHDYEGHISGSTTEIKGYCGYNSGEDNYSYCDFQISVGAFPERVEAGTELIIPATVTISNSQHKFVFESSAKGSASASLDKYESFENYDLDYSRINTVDDYNELHGSFVSSGVIYYDSYTKGNGSENADISFHFPDSHIDKTDPATYYIALMGGSYNFVTPGDRCDSVVILHAYQWQPPYSDVLPGVLPGEYTLPDTPAKEASSAVVTVDTKAAEQAGETDINIPEALAIAIIGGIAAIAGAGAGGNNSGNEDRKKKSRYKMCLRKDFGDAIRYDTQPIAVYARIVEITPEGEEIDRPDLSDSLEMFSGGGLKVESTAMAGNYMGVLVYAKSVPGGENPDKGVLSIRFAGGEGSFQNNVSFRLIGKPYISFPTQGNYLTMTLPMLLGDGEVYETPVILNDFLEKPTSVRLDLPEGVPLNCKLEEMEDIAGIRNIEDIEDTNTHKYILKVKNLSPKPEKLQVLKQAFGIGILAENDKEKAENSFNAELYPEGISIRELKFNDLGYVVIDTFDNEATDEWGDVVPTGFVLDFAVPEQDDEGRPTVRVLEPREYSPVFAGLKGTDKRTTHLAERFKYSIQEIPSNLKEYKFAPEEALVEEEGKPYYLTLPISCTYGQEVYTLELPLRLLGGGPGPLVGWDEAFAHLKKVVSKVGGISPELAKLLRENGKKMSTLELRLVTYRICHDAVIYYTRDAAEYEKIAVKLDNMLYYAEWLKWFGDQAFSYLITSYYGNTADAILSPAKDVFAALLGEIIDYLLNDEEITVEELETIKNITAGVDNLIINAFDDAISSKNISFKQICAVVAGFLVWKIAKNIYENRKDGKIDLYSAITALTADLTAMGVKKIAGNFFDKALKNSAVQNALNKPISKWMQNMAPNVFKGRWDIDKQGEYLLKIVEFRQSDIIKKYLEETFGAGAVTVVELGAESAQDWLSSTNDISASSVDLSAWPRISWVSEFPDQNDQKTTSLITIDLGFEAIGKFFEYLFGELFGEVPFATEAKSSPVDPPYFSE